MNLALSIDKPLFSGSTRPLMIRQDGKDIGYLKRWYRKTADNKIYGLKDQVHVSVFARDYEIEITENRLSSARGKEWEIRVSGSLTGHLVNNQSRKNPHSVNLDATMLPEIVVEKQEKNRGKIVIDGEIGGETFTGGRFIPTKFDAVINQLPDGADPLLLAGILYVYWFAS